MTYNVFGGTLNLALSIYVTNHASDDQRLHGILVTASSLLQSSSE